MQVGGEHLAVALAQRVTEDVARVGDELARGPRVAVLVAVEVVDEDLEQLRADRPDRAKLINGGERDDAGADELACLLGQLEQLDARRDPGLRPAERLRGPVFGQALVEHRLDRRGLLTGAARYSNGALFAPGREPALGLGGWWVASGRGAAGVERSGVLGMAFEIGGGSPDPGP